MADFVPCDRLLQKAYHVVTIQKMFSIIHSYHSCKNLCILQGGGGWGGGVGMWAAVEL